MGHLLPPKGRFSVELCRTSFKVHADYQAKDDDTRGGNLGTAWETFPHPEFRNEDLDDLIAVLQEAKRQKEGS